MKKYILVLMLFFQISFADIIKLASFNIQRLGESEKNYTVLAKIISKFDIIAIQEVMNKEGLEELVHNLDYKYSYVISKPVGTKKYKEHYAILYKKTIVNEIKNIGVYEDKNNDFIREPSAFYIKSKNLDIILIPVHSIYGDDERKRIFEASKYKNVYEYFYNKTKQDDIIILGDFNLPANDIAFDGLKNLGLVNILDPIVDKTTISKKARANAYDNIFLNVNNLESFTKRYGVYDYSLNNYEIIRRYISDHLPIFIEMDNNKD